MGSGKTTWIKQRLQNSEGIRYAVLVNDFGEINIDLSLIESESATSIGLSNGCVCCSLADNIFATLRDVEAMGSTIDWVLLEASGVADPERIVSQVENWPGFQYHDTVTLVDATRIRRLARDKFIGANIRHQLTTSSNLHLVKTDLLAAEDMRDVQAWLALKSRQNVAKLHPHPLHYSQTLSGDVSMERTLFEQWAERQQVERIKGFVFLLQAPQSRFLFQFVEGRWQLDDLGAWPGKAKTQLVVLGRTQAHVMACHLPNDIYLKEGTHGN